MLFTEPFFLAAFLPVSLLLFYSAGRVWGREAALAVALGASFVFYFAWGARSFGVMIVGTLVNFAVCYALLELSRNRGRLRGGLFAAGQAYNAATLVFFKYVSPMMAARGAGDGWLISHLAPVGISFYTFQQAVLLADCYARQPIVAAYIPTKPVWSALSLALLRFSAFHTFFPQLVVGPITYLSEFAPQVLREGFARLRRTDFEVGATLLIMGLFKKVILADGLGRAVDPVFTALSRGQTVDQSHAVLACLSYFPQLYFDFSGYSDMALGIARMFGMILPANFDSPLRASGIADYYRRWHITLTRVIVRFLFTPLAIWGGRTSLRLGWKGVAGRVLSSWLPLLLNFEVIALWHGISDSYILFGLFHGGWFVLETEITASKPWRRWRKSSTEETRRRVGQALTFVPLLASFALFRSDSVQTFSRLLGSLVHGGGATVADHGGAVATIVFAYAVVWLMPNSLEVTRAYRSAIRTWKNRTSTPRALAVRWRPDPLWGVVMAGMLVVALSHLDRKSPFIYMGF